MDAPLEFIFSFRSPYAWIAASRLIPKLSADFQIRWRPFFPLPTFGNFSAPPVDGKFQYLIRDVARMARFYDLPLTFPSPEDPDWAVPHVAFLAAEEQGQGPAFALELFAARWSRGEDVAEGEVMARAATAVGLDPAPILAAGEDPERKAALTAEVQRRFDADGIFGVPTLILPRGTRFWGHDRIDWAIREGMISSKVPETRP